MFKNSITCTVCPDFTTKCDHKYKQHCLSKTHYFNAHGIWPEGKKYKVSKDKSEISRLKEEISRLKEENSILEKKLHNAHKTAISAALYVAKNI